MTLPDDAVVTAAAPGPPFASAAASLPPATDALRLPSKIGAHDADRTRDLSLTKGVLYH